MNRKIRHSFMKMNMVTFGFSQHTGYSLAIIRKRSFLSPLIHTKTEKENITTFHLTERKLENICLIRDEIYGIVAKADLIKYPFLTGTTIIFLQQVI